MLVPPVEPKPQEPRAVESKLAKDVYKRQVDDTHACVELLITVHYLHKGKDFVKVQTPNFFVYFIYVYIKT